MTLSIAVVGKSGSGKTTVTKAITTFLHETYPDKSILLVDNDLSCELGYSFGVDVINTIYDVKVKRHEYKSRLPENMSRQEFIEWALQDIMISIDDNIDLIASGLVSSKDCRCYIAEKIDDSLVRLFENYDIVIFDCEYDLEYLCHLVDYHIDATIIIADPDPTSIYVSAKIRDSSQYLASPGQLGIILNKINGSGVSENISRMLSEYDLDILGTLPCDTELAKNGISKTSQILSESIRELIFRLNLPQL